MHFLFYCNSYIFIFIIFSFLYSSALIILLELLYIISSIMLSSFVYKKFYYFILPFLHFFPTDMFNFYLKNLCCFSCAFDFAINHLLIWLILYCSFNIIFTLLPTDKSIYIIKEENNKNKCYR